MDEQIENPKMLRLGENGFGSVNNGFAWLCLDRKCRSGQFGRVWGTKIHKFLTFFVFLSMQNLECNLEGQKIEKNAPKKKRNMFWSQFGGPCRPEGKDVGWGESLPELEFKALP